MCSTPAFARVLHNNRTNGMCMYIESKKELAHTITEAAKSKISRVGQHAGDQGRASVAVQV